MAIVSRNKRRCAGIVEVLFIKSIEAERAIAKGDVTGLTIYRKFLIKDDIELAFLENSSRQPLLHASPRLRRHSRIALSALSQSGAARMRCSRTRDERRRIGQIPDVQTGKEVAVAAGFEVTYAGRIARHSISPGLLLRLPFEMRRADVVHLTGVYWFTTIPTLLACRLLGKPLVWSPRGELQRWRGSRGRIPKRIWEIACRLAAPRSTMLHLASETNERESCSRFPNFGRGDSQRGASAGRTSNIPHPTESSGSATSAGCIRRKASRICSKPAAS